MREPATHTASLAIRLHPDLKRRLIEKARRDKMSPGEALRDALRAYLREDA